MRELQYGPIRLLDLEPSADDFHTAFVAGLSGLPKTLPCKFFYDKEGARLFERICELEEYYPTRAELGILRDRISQVSKQIGPGAQLIELGSGASSKTRILLEHLNHLAAYVPIEISRKQLVQVSSELAEEFRDIEVLPVCADYTQELQLPQPARQPEQTLLFFPGSTIGNFQRDEAAEFMRQLAQIAPPNSLLLIGVDLKKSPRVIEAAYNDSRGVTAAFNLNILERARRELGAVIDVDSFEHRAVYDQDQGRIEMRLISQRDQTISLGPDTFALGQGEFIVTEHSHKYHVSEFAELAGAAGFHPLDFWTDPRELFSVQLFQLAA